MNRHAYAREIMYQAVRDHLGREPTLAEIQFPQAVACFESNYGRGWRGPCEGSHNWGATQHGRDTRESVNHGTPCSEESCANRDSTPETGWYMGCYRRYASDYDGASHMVRVIYRSDDTAAAAAQGDLEGFARGMYEAMYYGGTSLDPETNVQNYTTRLRECVDAMASALGEEAAYTVSPNPFGAADPMSDTAESASGPSYLPLALGLGTLAAAGTYFLLARKS